MILAPLLLHQCIGKMQQSIWLMHHYYPLSVRSHSNFVLFWFFWQSSITDLQWWYICRQCCVFLISVVIISIKGRCKLLSLSMILVPLLLHQCIGKMQQSIWLMHHYHPLSVRSHSNFVLFWFFWQSSITDLQWWYICRQCCVFLISVVIISIKGRCKLFLFSQDVWKNPYFQVVWQSFSYGHVMCVGPAVHTSLVWRAFYCSYDNMSTNVEAVLMLSLLWIEFAYK